MEQNNFLNKTGVKILFIIAVFVVVFLLILALSLLGGIKKEEPSNSGGTPTPVARQIPTDVPIPTPAIQTPPGVLINRYGDVSFAYAQKIFPNSVDIYTFTPSPISKTSALTVATRLGFKDSPQETNTTNGVALSFNSNNQTALFYLEAGNVQYNSPSRTDIREINNPDQLSPLASSFLKKFSPYISGFSVDTEKITYSKGNGDLSQVSDFLAASVYDVPFSQKINNMTIYNQFGSNAMAHVLIGKDGQILKSTLNTPPLLDAKRKIEILPVSSAEKRIREGAGTIASYGGINNVETLPVPDKTTITSVELGYLRDFPGGIIYPIYIFAGTATAGNQAYPIVIYLPASK